MSRMDLTRWGGCAAVLAGILRGLASFIPTSTSVTLRSFYFVIDLLLFLGVIGLYRFQRPKTGRWGLVGFLLALIGAALLIGHDVASTSVSLSLYPVAALLFAVGISVFAIGAWRGETLPGWMAALLIASTPIGMLGYFVKGFEISFVLSGVIFSIGFAAAGLKVWLH